MDLTYYLIAASIVVGVAGQYLLKVGMMQAGKIESVAQLFSVETVLRMAAVWQIPVALVLYALGAFLWMAVLSREDLNFAYPFLGLTYVLVLFIGYFAFGEPITLNRLLGTLFVAVGVVVIARG